MKTTRIKIPLPTLTTRDDAETCMTSLAASINAQRAIAAERDAKILAINKEYESGLSTLTLAAQLKTEALRAWAEAHPEQFPKGRKSLALTSGLLGFRTGTPKLTLISRAWNWDKVLSELYGVYERFVRTKREVDKDSILAAYAEAELGAAELLARGMKVVQDESFFIEPALTQLETRQTTEAA